MFHQTAQLDQTRHSSVTSFAFTRAFQPAPDVGLRRWLPLVHWIIWHRVPIRYLAPCSGSEYRLVSQGHTRLSLAPLVRLGFARECREAYPTEEWVDGVGTPP